MTTIEHTITHHEGEFIAVDFTLYKDDHLAISGTYHYEHKYNSDFLAVICHYKDEHGAECNYFDKCHAHKLMDIWKDDSCRGNVNIIALKVKRAVDGYFPLDVQEFIKLLNIIEERSDVIRRRVEL